MISRTHDEYIKSSFTDQQFAMLQRIAGNLPIEQRAAFIEKTAAYMRMHGGYDHAVDVVERAMDLALRDVTQSAA
jgi:hypothetical protein